MKRKFMRAMQLIGFHSLVLLRGFVKALYGAVTAALIAAAFYGFKAIPTEGGYAAVGDFIAAIACVGVALACMYVFGCRRRCR